MNKESFDPWSFTSRPSQINVEYKFDLPSSLPLLTSTNEVTENTGITELITEDAKTTTNLAKSYLNWHDMMIRQGLSVCHMVR